MKSTCDSKVNQSSKERRQEESLESRLWRVGGNLFPAYRRSDARITYVSADFHEVHIKIPSNWRTRNHMGITWGGGLYSALDPVFGVMLYKILNFKHRVIDKRAEIHFKKPARETLYAKFRLERIEIKHIRASLAFYPKLERTYTVDLEDCEGAVYATCTKTLCIFS